MYKYKDIAFRVIEHADLEKLRFLHNEQETYLNLLNIDFIDEENQLNWWKNLHKKTNDKRFVVVKSDKPNEMIGRLRIQNINEHHRNCEIGIDIIPSQRGKGFGEKSYKMLLEYLFIHFNMNMVYLKVADFNPNAIKLYSKVGFRKTGLLPSFFFRHGKYWDYLIMGITKDEYMAINS